MFTKAFVERIENNTIYCISNGTSCMHCKNKLLCKKPDKPFEIKNPNNIEVNIGDMVDLELNGKNTVISLLITLLFPLIIVVSTVIVISYITLIPIVLFSSALLSLSVALYVVYIINKKNKDNNTPVLIKNTKVNLTY